MSEQQFDPAELKKVGMIQQKQKEFFALRLRVAGGDLSSEQLDKIAETAKKYGKAGFIYQYGRGWRSILYATQTLRERARNWNRQA